MKARLAVVGIAIAFAGFLLLAAAPTGTALADKCSSSLVSTNCAHHCTQETNKPEKCETCSYAVSGYCYVDTNPQWIE